MPIIKFTKNTTTPDFALLNLYPNQFETEKNKQENDWIKINMDYFYNVAINQFSVNKDRIVPNYELLKGILRKSDFDGSDPETKTFVDTLLQSEDLPAYVKHYSILTPPINTLVGEMSKRPDNIYVRAMDDDSKAEELEFKTELLQQYVLSNARQYIYTKLAAQGIELDEEQLNQMTQEELEGQLGSYTSVAEKWGARILEFEKVMFNLKEKSEDAFRDLLISAREFFHIYEDNSNLGFNVEVLNPKNVWILNTPDRANISDPLEANNGAYAAGTINVMELSEILQKFNLTKEEIEHLRNMSQQAYLINQSPSNLVDPSVTGPNSVRYDTYDPAVLQYRQIVEGELQENGDELSKFLGITNTAGVFGNKYLVVRAYWCSKKKIGKLTFVNEDNQTETVLVDENYKDGSHPQQLDIEWGWVNQWYQGVRIGLDVYYVKPLEILDYCPIIGTLFEVKNLNKPVSLIDQMKPFQIIYNIAMNQLYRLLEKDQGVVFLTSIRHVPVPKDGDYQDALEAWEMDARERGIIFIDDSPENMKAPSSFNQHRAIDLSRANEIEARYRLAAQMRDECWRLVGLSEQRLGSTASTETATGINTALTQSYAQTEPWFAKHEYTINKLYQALLDASQYIESNKPTSTLSYISNEGESGFLKVNGSDLKMRDLGVLVTSRSEDARNFQELRGLAQAMLQNGASPYEIALLYDTKSIRKMKEIFKSLKDKADQFQQQQQQMEQQKIQQQDQQFQKQQELMQLQQEKQQAYDAYQKEQERINKLQIAYIQANAKDSSGNPVPPSDLDLSRFDAEQQKASSDYQLRIQELTQKQQQLMLQNSMAAQNIALQKDKIAVEREKIKSTERIAKLNKNPKK